MVRNYTDELLFFFKLKFVKITLIFRGNVFPWKLLSATKTSIVDCWIFIAIRHLYVGSKLPYRANIPDIDFPGKYYRN